MLRASADALLRVRHPAVLPAMPCRCWECRWCRLLLGLSLPWAIWPAAVLMLGGSAMYVVPSISQSASGSLDSPSAWFGFGLSLVAMASAVTFLCVIQATRHCGFKIWVLQYQFIFSVLFTMLTLSLPIEGTDWAAQLAGWGATDWCLLALLGSVVYVGSNFRCRRVGREGAWAAGK
ncbi:hypothetical protein ABPG75_003434 [Micractinium tetrahymenae]